MFARYILAYLTPRYHHFTPTYFCRCLFHPAIMLMLCRSKRYHHYHYDEAESLPFHQHHNIALESKCHIHSSAVVKRKLKTVSSCFAAALDWASLRQSSLLTLETLHTFNYSCNYCLLFQIKLCAPTWNPFRHLTIYLFVAELSKPFFKKFRQACMRLKAHKNTMLWEHTATNRRKRGSLVLHIK